MAENDVAGIHLGFYSKTLKDDPHPLALVGVDGREEISRLFEFDLLLYRRGEPLEEDQLAALVSDPCVIALGTKKTDIVHGVLASIEHIAGGRERGSYYRAKLLPYTSLVSLGRRNAIYQETTVPDMVSAIFASYGLARDKHFEIHGGAGSKSPEHEYIVQFEESDWDFVQRWLEREGFFYWFRHTAEGVVLVIADNNDDATPIDSPSKISYRERNNLARGDASESIWSFHVRQKRVESSVTLVDYNYRRPLDLLISSSPVDEKGFGHFVEYGDHFKETGVGDEWAQIRAQELYAQRRVVSGTTDCARLRVGHSFELENHYFAGYDGKYLVTSIVHRAGVPTNVEDDFAELPPPRAYQARFTAVPLGVPYRPQRKTRWPRIDGVISGHIEADTSGDFAQIDDQGRYKVKFPFDLGTNRGLASSRWIRMAQAYAGSAYGQHMPQHKGTEVLVAHIGGDPDRPVIVGAVPNPVTPSPVVTGNATQSVLMTASGIRVELEDQA